MHLLSVCVASQIDFAEKETPFQSNHHQIGSTWIRFHPFYAPGIQRPERKSRIIFVFYGGLTLPGKNVPRDRISYSERYTITGALVKQLLPCPGHGEVKEGQ
jgi:hypothetical protein